MSGTATNTVNTPQQSTVNFDQSKIFIGSNRFESRLFESNAGQVVLVEGQVMGEVSATGEVVPLKSAAIDGSDLPFGILTDSITIEIGEIPSLTMCIFGEVAREKVVFDGADDFDTVVSGRRLETRITADTMGIQLQTTDELTEFDN